MTERADPGQFFNWPNIISEAKQRHATAVASTASAITPEMRTLEYWTAWCAHANAASCADYLCSHAEGAKESDDE